MKLNTMVSSLRSQLIETDALYFQTQSFRSEMII